MAIFPFAYYEGVKRYWRRKKYQRLGGASPHCEWKIKNSRVGGGADDDDGPPRRRRCRIRGSRKERHLKIVSPVKLLAKFHDAYVGMMVGLANKIANSNNNGGLFRGKRVAKARRVSLVYSGDKIDCKLLVEKYKKIAASRQSNIVNAQYN